MQDEQPSFLQNDDQLLEIAFSIDPKILSHFRLLEQPYRGGSDFRYLYTTDQVQEVLIQSVQLSGIPHSPLYLDRSLRHRQINHYHPDVFAAEFERAI